MRKKIAFFTIATTLLLFGEIRDKNIAPQNPQPMHIKILDQKELKFKKIDNRPFVEISDLAYDKNTSTLYMISDKGSLFGFATDFNETIEKLTPLYGVKLTKKNGGKLKTTDAEGLALHPTKGLLVSFEKHPTIANFDTNGHLKERYKLPPLLRDIHHYRGRNKGLESLAYHPTYGILTATEFPLKGMPEARQAIYSLNRQVWHFSPQPYKKNGITALEVMKDGNVLVLERAKQGINNFIVTLKKIYLDRCDHSECQSQILAKLDSSHGFKTENFEGLAHISGDRFVMISDDSSSSFQKTILVYFEVLPTAR